MMDIFDRIKNNPGPLGQFADYGEGYFIFPELEGELGPRMKFKGKDVIVWSLNNYLGLANHPEVRKADADAAAKYGMAYPMGARAMRSEERRVGIECSGRRASHVEEDGEWRER